MCGCGIAILAVSFESPEEPRSLDPLGIGAGADDELTVMPSGDNVMLTSGFVSLAGGELTVTTSVSEGKGVYAGGKSSVAETLIMSRTLSVSIWRLFFDE